MGGTVDVSNRDPGAEFRVALPLCGGAAQRPVEIAPRHR
jgi:hypothetical protein